MCMFSCITCTPSFQAGRPLRTRPMAVFFLRAPFISIACMRYRRGRPKGVPLRIVGMTILGYGAFFHTSPVMNSVYTIISGGPPYQVGPYEPGRWPYFFCGLHSFPSPACDIVGDAQRASRYALRASRSVVVSLRLSRRYAASESAKKAVARGSWLVKAHYHSEWAVVKYHSGPPFGTAPTSYEPLTTNNKKSTGIS